MNKNNYFYNSNRKNIYQYVSIKNNYNDNSDKNGILVIKK